jgi:glycosidase
VPLDGTRFAARLEDLLRIYPPEVVAAQLNLLGSHDTPRLRTVVGGDLPAVRLAMLLIATLPGAPCIYYGDEIGLLGGNDPLNRQGFPRDPTRWDGDLRAFVKALLDLRREEPALRSDVVVVRGAIDGAVAFERLVEGRRLLVVVNAGDAPASIDLPADAGLERLTAFWGDPVEIDGEAVGGGGGAWVRVGPRSGSVLVVS